MNSGLTIGDLHRLERLLHERRESVEAQLETLLGRSEDECGLALKEDVFGKEEETMLAELYAGFKADVQRLRMDLGQIEAALRRHVDRTYGTCVHCGHTIAIDRLLSQPEVVHCESCVATPSPEKEAKVA